MKTLILKVEPTGDSIDTDLDRMTDQRIEQGVNEALKSFQNFCLDQMVAAWFADAPDPAALIEEILTMWEAANRARFARAARQQSEATGIVITGGTWLDDVITESKKRIRAALDKVISDATIAAKTEKARVNQ